MRVAKPLREQVKNLVLCRKLFNCLQFNKLIDGNSIHEENGKVKMEVKKGDKVVVSKYAGTEVKYEGEDLIIVSQNDILAIVE